MFRAFFAAQIRHLLTLRAFTNFAYLLIFPVTISDILMALAVAATLVLSKGQFHRTTLQSCIISNRRCNLPNSCALCLKSGLISTARLLGCSV